MLASKDSLGSAMIIFGAILILIGYISWEYPGWRLAVFFLGLFMLIAGIVLRPKSVAVKKSQ